MTNAEIIQAIRVKVGKIRAEHPVGNYGESFEGGYDAGYCSCCCEIEDFLSDIEKSLPTKVTDGDELEIEIERVVAEYSEKVQGTRVMKPSGVEKIARRFYDLGCRRTAEKYDEIEYNRQRAEESIPNDLEETAMRYKSQWNTEHPHSPDIDFIAGAKWQKEQMMEGAVKWLVDDDYHESSEKGRFILGSVGLGYNGYYIPYSDLLKLPKED